MNDVAAAKDLLEALAAEPRPAGSKEEARARQCCATLLREYGFELEEQAFEYSTLPGRWSAPISGALVLLLGAGAALVDRAVVLHLVPLSLIVLGTLLILSERAVLGAPFLRASSVNLVASRGAPGLWLAAHLDSKSQPVSLRTRIVAVGGAVAGMSVLVALWVIEGTGLATVGSFAWSAAGGFTVVGALPLVASTVGSRSPGAADNAAGVAAVLLAVRNTDRPVGVVFTSAEELALAGARAWVRDRCPQTIVNVDTVDDEGVVRCLVGTAGDAVVAGRVMACAADAGVAMRRSRLPIGALVDSAIFRRSGWSAVTITRVSWATLGRVHTPADTADRSTGAGIAETARVVVACIEKLV